MQQKLKNNTSNRQSVKFEITGRQSVNGPNYKWIKCIFLLINFIIVNLFGIGLVVFSSNIKGFSYKYLCYCM